MQKDIPTVGTIKSPHKDTQACRDLESAVAGMKELPANRETSIAITHAESALLWLNKATNGAGYRGARPKF